jgi:hypothetical protein
MAIPLQTDGEQDRYALSAPDQIVQLVDEDEDA